MTSDPTKRFTAVFLCVFVVLGSAIFVFKRTDLFPWIGACHAGGYDSDHYLAYCHNTRYGDYEHYALYQGTEQEAIKALKQAQVLFLGNSNTQFAFSTDAVAEYFKEAGINHYVLGFGNGAMSAVAESVILKHQLTPALLVINADPFFSDEINGTFQAVLDAGDSNAGQYQRKRQLQYWQADVCADGTSFWANRLCRGRAETLYRSSANGHWKTDFYRENQQIPVGANNDALVDDLSSAEHFAREFMLSVGIEPHCVVLTVSPRTRTPREFAEKLSNSLGTEAVFPTVEQLNTIDHSHLDPESAERWSAAVVAELGDVIARCSAPAMATTL